MSWRARTLARAALLVPLAACNALTGAGDLTTAPADADVASHPALVASDGSDASDPPDGSSSFDGAITFDAAPPVVPGFAYRRTVTLTSDAPSPLSGRAVLVVLPSTFDYTHVKANGEDLRFRSPANADEDLPYYLEKWQPGAESWVWVRAPVVPVGTSILHLIYGKADATAETSFDATFPNAQRTVGGGAGSFTASGDIDVDWFELRAGDTLSLSPGGPLTIRAERIIITSTVDGNGRGYAGGLPTQQDGNGPGAGKAGGSGNASGGGGYGGVGGRGGSDTAGAGGAGGAQYGTAAGSDIALGSGGASAQGAGGAGGGAISLFGWRTTVTGTVKMNGVDGAGLSGQNAGGGSGGGILAAACFLELGGAQLEAKGGAGGPCSNSGNDGGGGGGGGRIKLRRRTNGSYVAPSVMTAAFGLGATDASTTAPGENGAAGTTDLNQSSNVLKGVEASVGPEMPAL